MVRTAEQIANLAEKSKTGLGQRKIINQLFRSQDDSDKWPIRGRFNVTERAIRHARLFEKDCGFGLDPLEYALFLENDMSSIVNDPKNL